MSKRTPYVPQVFKTAYTMEQINAADHYTLARWWRFGAPGSVCHDAEGDRLQERLFKEFGGITPEISKSLGWER
jgi:hypothetical protein